MAADVILEAVFGYLGLVLWSFQLLPQAISNYRLGGVGALSALMMLMWALWAPIFSAYGLYSNMAVPLLIQPNIFGFLALLCFVQCLYYRRSVSSSSAVATGLFCILLVVVAGLEVALFIAIKHAHGNDVSWAPTMIGVLPTVLITGGFIPQYYDIIKTGNVNGISQCFLAMDTLGGVFSIIALVFHPRPFDFLSLGSYVAVVVLDVGLLILIQWYNWCAARPKESSAVDEVRCSNYSSTTIGDAH
ncbi:hypothetical protein SpCBS45565_g07190 [Spizellomyces sp. 'palustris']|nr:hypothetical protein SpCBS45565_g07190 [Spizellomyces sp. 'palustris']